MLRVIHNQTVQNAILIDDIDDGLPNKPVHRLGSTADPKAYMRDGIIGKPKQPCYVPRTQASEGFPLVQGYINLARTEKVTLSEGKGKIYGLVNAGLVSTLTYATTAIAAPTLTIADLDNPGVGDLTLTGTVFVSIAPDETTVIITGTGAITLTGTAIIAAGGTIGAGSIFIPTAMFVVPLAVGTSLAQVLANEQLTAVVVLS